jgi:phospholipid transport system substrate-binding protein
MVIRSFPAIFSQAIGQPIVPKMPLFKAVAFVAGLGLSMLSYPVHATPAGSSDTVQGLYDALLGTMKNGRILGQSGRFTQLEPVIRRSFDIAAMARLAVGPSWASLTEAQREQVTESFGRYISAIYADCFDSYAGQTLEVTGEQPAPSGVMVRSQIIKANGEPAGPQRARVTPVSNKLTWPTGGVFSRTSRAVISTSPVSVNCRRRNLRSAIILNRVRWR